MTARQSLVWADEQILPESRYHHWVLVVHVEGELDFARLRQAFSETTRDHDAMSLVVDTRMPRQRFGSDLAALRQVELAPGMALSQWIAEQSCRDFDRSRQPWDAVFIKPTPHESVFVLRAHYLVCDESSFAHLATELSRRYLGQAPEPAGSFAAVLREQSSAPRLAAAEHDVEAWKTLLATPPPPAGLLGRTRLGMGAAVTRIVRTISGGPDKRSSIFGTAESEPTNARHRASDIALTTVILSWLHRLSGQRDIVVAIPIDTREPTETPVVGLLTEPLLLRVEFDESETFQSLSSKIRNGRDFAQSHRSASLGSLDSVTAFVGNLPPWPEGFCGCRAHFTLGNAPVWSKTGLGPGDGRDTLTVRFGNNAAGVEVHFDFNDDTFSPEVRERLVAYFDRFLDAFAADAAMRIQEVEWLTPEEQDALRALGQGRRPPIAPDLLVAFDRQVREQPDRIAVEFADRTLTYLEFDRVTNRLARRLREAGVTTESRVAVAMPRGIGELAALFSTIKAGGAYVPVDPGHPVERVRVILEDAEPQVLVAPANSPLRAAVPPGVGYLELDDPLVEGTEVDDGPFGNSAEPSQLAYILFTSGSTGRPKGVEISRGAFANFLQSMAEEPKLTANDRVIAITTTTFDIAGLELFLPLYVGGTVVIADRDTAADPLRLRAMFERSNISMMQATPATWRLLLDAGWAGRPGLRMLCGGEAMSLALARRLAACGSELWNMYGPTETTVWSTLELISPQAERITIGHPIDHTVVDLRDTQGRLVPPGTIGEICIGGLGLARGYRGRSDLTADRFPTDPKSGERFYRTGDLGRYLPDGRLECLGRVDHQVKIRGFRIEPADIEAQLRSVDGVQEVLVVARTAGEGDPLLVAYWVGAAGRDALHHCAKERLPHYMVPSAYVHLDVFPLTTSGKIDRKQLPAPELQSTETDAGTAPRNDQESIVAAIWRDVLGLSFVPVDKDFFSLGGTSVRAIQMRAKIQDAFGINLSLRSLFEQPTVAAIVSQLGSPEDEDAPVVTWLARGEDPIPWIGLMGIQLFEDIALALPKDQSLLAMHVPIRYVKGADAFPTVTEIARKYVPIIRRYQSKGPYYLLGLCHGGVVAFEVAAQLEEAGETVAVVGLLDAELPHGRRIVKSVRLQHAWRKLLQDPKALVTRALETLERRAPALASLLGRAPQTDTTQVMAEPVDMPFDGPEIDADLACYEAQQRRVLGRIVAFRATKSELPPWITVDRDLGWSGRAGELQVHDIAASHLGIMRAPYASAVAQHLMAARKITRKS